MNAIQWRFQQLRYNGHTLALLKFRSFDLSRTRKEEFPRMVSKNRSGKRNVKREERRPERDKSRSGGGGDSTPHCWEHA